eukprot:scaffold6932_cov28-Tisochrysis_lutea.AAC.4
MSAPRSTMPICISKSIGTPSSPVVAYRMASSRSCDVDTKARSTPPRMPCSFGCQKAAGSTPPETPRYTRVTRVSLLALTTSELMAWIGFGEARASAHWSRVEPPANAFLDQEPRLVQLAQLGALARQLRVELAKSHGGARHDALALDRPAAAA